MATIGSRIQMRRDTTAKWDARKEFIPLEGEIIVYLDHDTDYDGNFIPAIKIGDGKAYLIDLPFTDSKTLETLNSHINNTDIHVTKEEKALMTLAEANAGTVTTARVITPAILSSYVTTKISDATTPINAKVVKFNVTDECAEIVWE